MKTLIALTALALSINVAAQADSNIHHGNYGDTVNMAVKPNTLGFVKLSSKEIHGAGMDMNAIEPASGAMESKMINKKSMLWKYGVRKYGN